MQLKQSTARNVALKVFLTSDHVSPATGKTLTVTLSKDGAAFAGAAGAVTELSNGWYKIALTTADTNTLGDLAIRATAADSDAAERLAEVVAFDPQSATNLGLSNLNAASSTLATAAALATVDDFLDTEIAAIKAKTDNLPASPAAVGDLAPLATQASVNTIDDFLDTEIAAIKAKTDLIPASPAAVSDVPTAAQNADALLDRANGIETGWTVREAFRIVLAALGGKLSGAATATVTIRDVGDSKTRVTATVDADGNRSAVTYDKT